MNKQTLSELSLQEGETPTDFISRGIDLLFERLADDASEAIDSDPPVLQLFWKAEQLRQAWRNIVEEE